MKPKGSDIYILFIMFAMLICLILINIMQNDEIKRIEDDNKESIHYLSQRLQYYEEMFEDAENILEADHKTGCVKFKDM